MLPTHFEEIEDGDWVEALGYDIAVSVKGLGQLSIPSGMLVGCDPVNHIEGEPFSEGVEPGCYPVRIYIAHLRDEPVIAYAALNVASRDAETWQRLGFEDGDESGSEGYRSESSVGCFVDEQTASYLMQYRQHTRQEDDDFYRHLLSRLDQRREEGCGWAEIKLHQDLQMPLDMERNLFAFDTGQGPGLYQSWVGFDEEGEAVSIVTDFDVLDCRFRRFPGE